ADISARRASKGQPTDSETALAEDAVPRVHTYRSLDQGVDCSRSARQLLPKWLVALVPSTFAAPLPEAGPLRPYCFVERRRDDHFLRRVVAGVARRGQPNSIPKFREDGVPFMAADQLVTAPAGGSRSIRSREELH